MKILAAILLVFTLSACGTATKTVTVPGPERVVTKTVKVPGPERIVTKTVNVPVPVPGPPGPTQVVNVPGPVQYVVPAACRGSINGYESAVGTYAGSEAVAWTNASNGAITSGDVQRTQAAYDAVKAAGQVAAQSC